MWRGTAVSVCGLPSEIRKKTFFKYSPASETSNSRLNGNSIIVRPQFQKNNAQFVQLSIRLNYYPITKIFSMFENTSPRLNNCSGCFSCYTYCQSGSKLMNLLYILFLYFHFRHDFQSAYQRSYQSVEHNGEKTNIDVHPNVHV